MKSLFICDLHEVCVRSVHHTGGLTDTFQRRWGNKGRIFDGVLLFFQIIGCVASINVTWTSPRQSFPPAVVLSFH